MIGFLRYIFLITILVGSTSIGFLISKSYHERLKELQPLEKLINIIKNKMKFTHKPIGEIFEEVSNFEKDSTISKIFLKTSKKIKSTTFEKGWNEAIREEQTSLNLKKEDINLLKSFSNMIGKTDIEGQMSEINEFEVLLKNQIELANEEYNKNSKMYKSLGTILGLGIVILLF